MEDFAVIPDNFEPQDDYWELNPQHKYLPPFADLYNKFSHNKSSKYMWACVIMSHPDRKKNKLYGLPYDERVETVQQYYLPKAYDWQDETFQRCMEQWPILCLSIPARTLKAELDFLVKRSTFLTNAPYNLETMVQIDAAVSKTAKIYENYDRVKSKYDTARKGVSRVEGQRNETESERGLL